MKKKIYNTKDNFDAEKKGFNSYKNVIGFNCIEKPEYLKEFSFEKVDVDYLERVIDILKELYIDEIYVGVNNKENSPLIFKFHEHENSQVVLMIAPITDE